MNVLEIVIAAVLVLLAFSGFQKGFVKKLASMVSLVLSVILVSVTLPYITEYLKENTPVYEYIAEQCTNIMLEQVSESLLAGSRSVGTGQDSGSFGLNVYRNMGQDQIGQLTRIEQTELIENLPLPERLKDLLLDYNNEEGYKSLRVTNFPDYVVNFIATSILNVIAFIVSVLLVQLLLWALLTALNVLAHIPVICFVNRLAGLLLGILQALFLIWIFFLILSMVSATNLGMQIMGMVQESAYLSWLYESNLFLQVVLQAATIFTM